MIHARNGGFRLQPEGRIILTLILVLRTLSAGAQQPARDTLARVTQAGTASVSGVVTLGDDAQTPVRRAVITMLSANGVETRSTVSDDEGRFAIGGLPAGRYTLQALKPSHLTMAYGARQPGRLGTSLVLADGESMRNLRLSLPRGAVLAGRLTLENGEPLPNTLVMAMPARLSNAGGTVPMPAREFRTDDRGEFRIYGLLPDAYLVAAVFQIGSEFERRSDADFDTIVRWLQRPATAPTGRTAVAQPVAQLDALPTPSQAGYAPTYFPGTAVAAAATPIVVRTGEIRDGLDFTIARSRLATISGTVIGAGGERVQAARVSVEREGPPLPCCGITTASIMSGVSRQASPNASGEFSIAGLSPGHYHVRAHAAGTIARGGDTFAQTEWALKDVDIAGDDVTGLTLALQPGRVFSGTLAAAVASAPASPARPPSLAGAVVVLQPIAANAGLVLNGLRFTNAVRQAPVGPDGRFTVTGLVPSDYALRVTLPPALTGGGWRVESIRQRGRDLRDAPLTFDSGSIEGVEVTLTTAVTELAGIVTSESGAAAADFFLVAFPEDRVLWHPASPRIRVVRPAVDGAFSILDLPAGAYRLAAVNDIGDDELTRREFMESMYDTSVRVMVESGKRTVQELRIK